MTARKPNQLDLTLCDCAWFPSLQFLENGLWTDGTPVIPARAILDGIELSAHQTGWRIICTNCGDCCATKVDIA